MTELEQLQSLVSQAFDELRRYEKAAIRADGGAPSSEMVTATETLHTLLERIDRLKLETWESLSAEMKAEVKKLDDAVEASEARVILMLKGQRKELEVGKPLALAVSESARFAGAAALHMTVFAAKWLRDRDLAKESLTEAQTIEYKKARIEELVRFKDEHPEFGPLEFPEPDSPH